MSKQFHGNREQMCARSSASYPELPESLLMSDSWSHCKNHYCFQVSSGTAPCQPWRALPGLQDVFVGLSAVRGQWSGISDLSSHCEMKCPRSPQAGWIQLELRSPVWSDTRVWLKWSCKELEHSGAVTAASLKADPGHSFVWMCFFRA